MAQMMRAVESTTHLPRRGPRGAWLAIAITVACVVGSCAGRDAPLSPGISEAPWSHDAPSASVSAHRPARWSDFDSVPNLTVIAPKFASHGHGTGAWEAELRGNALAAGGFDGLVPGSSLPAGALLVQSLVQRHSGADLGFFAMRKREPGYFPAGGDWEYLVVERDGTITASGRLEGCARCHADAPADFVFPRYRPAAASSAD